MWAAHHGPVLCVLPGPGADPGGTTGSSGGRSGGPGDRGGGPASRGVRGARREGLMGAPFEAGDRALLVDDRGRRFLVRLEREGTFHYHGGAAPPRPILHPQEGTGVHSTPRSHLTCLRPRLADLVLWMAPRAP